MIKNSLNIELPEYIEGYGEVRPYKGAFETKPSGNNVATKKYYSIPGSSKLIGSLQEAIKKSGLKDGMTISFHHHLRQGDSIVMQIVKEIADMKIKNIHLNASSLTEAQEGLIEYIRAGVITKISTSGLRGELAKEISTYGILKTPVIFRSHGGRARAIESGELYIDVAFVGTPCCDPEGNMNGHQGACAFGAMGYPMVDVKYANVVIAVTDNLQPYPLQYISIDQTYVDYVVKVDSIGDASKIATGAIRITSNPIELLIAEKATQVLIASGYIKEGFSFQAGAGGASLAVAKYLREYMIENQIKGSFASGGITAYLVELLQEKLFSSLLDVQTFDGSLGSSLHENPNHVEMSASMYANPHNKSCVAHKLDIMILAATEIDVHFHVNSLTGSHGIILGAIGGAPDTAAGAKITIMTVPCLRKRLPIVVDKVTNIVTPGETVDVLVTDMGICVNPKRQDLVKKLTKSRIPIMDIHNLHKEILRLAKLPAKVEYTDKIIGVIEYRDGTVIDLIRQIKS